MECVTQNAGEKQVEGNAIQAQGEMITIVQEVKRQVIF